MGERRTILPAEEHVLYMFHAMVETQGESVSELHTRNDNRRFWKFDHLASRSWASPVVGQHQLYLPDYLKDIAACVLRALIDDRPTNIILT